MVKAILVHRAGGPGVMVWEDVEVPDPGPGEARIVNTAVGLNFVDSYMRRGLGPFGDGEGSFPMNYPAVLGFEGAGVIDAVGDGVSELAPGDRVAYTGLPMGAYAESRVMPADQLVPLPDDIDDQTAACAMTKGITVEYLLRRCYPVACGETVLIHAAAGGCGLIACQWARHLGATVIGTVSSDEKAALAHSHGCDHPIVYGRDDVVARVKEITGGLGVSVVYDAVGRDTFTTSLDCLARRGHLVNFGQASGPVGSIHLSELTNRESLYVTRPTLFSYISTRAELLDASAELFAMIRLGAVRIKTNQTYPLKDAARAHADLDARKTTGSSLLMP